MRTSIYKAASRLQRGFTAIEMIVVLIVSVSALSLGSAWLNNYSDNMLNQAAAEHGKSVSDAATRYIKDNNSAILAIATPAVPATITVAMLQGAGYLPSSFTANNPYGQAYSILALEPVAGQLQTLIVTTGGDTISEMNLRRTAQLIGAKGGYVSSLDTTKAQGSYGGWSIPLASYGVTPGAGHVAMALFFQDGALVSDYLYRGAVSGHPELNQMATNLDLGGFRLTNLQAVATIGSACGAGVSTGDVARGPAGEVLSCQGGIWNAQGSAYWKDPVANAASLPVCNAAAKWQTRIVGTPAVGAQPRAYTCDGASWVALGVDNNGNLTLPGTTMYASSGAETSYGGLTVRGSKNGWAGINFKDSAGSNAGTLMMHPSYSGFYNAADNNWRWYTDDSGNTLQAGTATMANAVITGTAVVGGACAPNGKVAQDGTGLLLSCQSGVWRAAQGTPSLSSAQIFTLRNTVNSCPAGWHLTACSVFGLGGTLWPLGGVSVTGTSCSTPGLDLWTTITCVQ